MKKGFTLIELLMVIGIMGIILLIAIPSYTLINQKIKESMYNAKVAEILAKGEVYSENTNNFAFSVNTLVEEGLLSSDNETGQILDPRDKRKMNCDIVEINPDQSNYIVNDECLTDDEINNRFGILKLVVKNDKNEVVSSSSSSWHSSKVDTISYEFKEGYENFKDKILSLKWYGEEEILCDSTNIDNCNAYTIAAENVKNITVHLNVVFSYDTVEISRTYDALLAIDNQKPSLVANSLILDNDIATSNLRKVSFLLTDYNGSGVDSYSLSSNKTCENYKSVTGEQQTEYLNNGTYYLCIKDKVGNVNDNFDENKIDVSNVDFTKPQLSFNIKSTENGYNSKNAKLTINANDDEGTENLQMCISSVGYLQNCTFENFVTTKNWSFDGNYDGSTKTIYITVMDKAGNLTSSSQNYTLYKTCSKTTAWEEVSSTKNTCPSCGNANYTINYRNKDAYLGSVCQTKSESKSCSAKSCIEYRYRYVKSPTTAEVSYTPLAKENKHACLAGYSYGSAYIYGYPADMCYAGCYDVPGKKCTNYVYGICVSWEMEKECISAKPGVVECPSCTKGDLYYLGTSNVSGYKTNYLKKGIQDYGLNNCSKYTDYGTKKDAFVQVGYYTCINMESTCPSGYTLLNNKCYTPWSSWSSTPVTANSYTEVETRTP